MGILDNSTEKILNQKAKKCWQEVQVVLDKYNCIIIANPSFKLMEDRTFNVSIEVKIVPGISTQEKKLLKLRSTKSKHRMN